MNRRPFSLIALIWMLPDLIYCNCDVKETIKTGQDIILTSPNYPSNISPNTHCFYDLTTELNSGGVLHITVLDVTLECNELDTSFEVFDGYSVKAKAMGQVCVGGSSKFVSPREKLYLTFKTGSHVSNQTKNRGFRIRVASVPEFSHCYSHEAKVMSVTPESHYIVSPYYPDQVAPSVQCRWLLKAPIGQQVILDVLTADLRGSNSCSNFGLEIFDGKTTYDDIKLGSVCSNVSQSFHSTGNYMIVVFTSGSHVMHSGGGVKLGYYSTITDTPESAQKDSSLLFILIGVLLGIASFTIIMVVLRFLVIPARRQAINRHNNARTSNLNHSSMTMLTIQSDPPPPYRQTVANPHRQKRKGMCASTCACCCSYGKFGRDSNSHGNIGSPVSDFLFVVPEIDEFRSNHIITPHLLSAIAGYARSTGLNPNSLSLGVAQHGREGNVNRSETTSNTDNYARQFNEYHELPTLTATESDCGLDSEVAISDRSVSGINSQLESCSNYETVGHREDARPIKNTVYQIYDTQNGDSDHGISRCVDNLPEVSVNGLNSTSAGKESYNNLTVSVNDGHTENRFPSRVDDFGYEVPVAFMYNGVTERSGDSDEEGEEGVYHTLNFSEEELSKEENVR